MVTTVLWGRRKNLVSFVWLIITEYRLGWRLLGWASWSKMKGAFWGTRVALGVKQKLKPGFPMFVGCCLWGLFLYLLSSSRFKKSFCLPQCTVLFPCSVSAACDPCSKISVWAWLRACSSPVFHLPASSDGLILGACACFSLTHVVPLGCFTRGGIFPS